jgi:hypothetical protein
MRSSHLSFSWKVLYIFVCLLRSRYHPARKQNKINSGVRRRVARYRKPVFSCFDQEGGGDVGYVRWYILTGGRRSTYVHSVVHHRPFPAFRFQRPSVIWVPRRPVLSYRLPAHNFSEIVAIGSTSFSFNIYCFVPSSRKICHGSFYIGVICIFFFICRISSLTINFKKHNLVYLWIIIQQSQ